MPATARPSATSAEFDDAILARVQAGDQAAARALVLRHQDAVYGLVWRLVGPWRAGLVEDLVQESFLRAFRSLPGYRTAGPAKFSTWLLVIATRAALDALRREAARPTLTSWDEPAGQRGADSDLRQRRLAEAIERALGEVGEGPRAAFVLREYHGLDYQQIAEALDLAVGTVKSRLHTARQAVHAAIEEVHE